MVDAHVCNLCGFLLSELPGRGKVGLIRRGVLERVWGIKGVAARITVVVFLRVCVFVDFIDAEETGKAGEMRLEDSRG